MNLKSNEACKYGSICPYNNQQGQNFCIGANPNRPGLFNCTYVSDEGVFTEGKFRSKHDETGKMQVILESK